MRNVYIWALRCQFANPSRPGSDLGSNNVPTRVAAGLKKNLIRGKRTGEGCCGMP